MCIPYSPPGQSPCFVYCSVNNHKMLTFLNWSRLQILLPKNLRTAGSWAFNIIIGSICFTLYGIKYQFSWPKTSSISMNAPLSRWPISLGRKIKTSAQISQKIDTNKTTGLISSCDCKNGKKNFQSSHSCAFQLLKWDTKLFLLESSTLWCIMFQRHQKI